MTSMEQDFSSPFSLRNAHDLKFCLNPQCTNNKRVGVCLKSPISSGISARYEWAVKYKCGDCKCSWFLCKLCPNMNSQLKSTKDLYNHNYSYHRPDQESNSTYSIHRKKLIKTKEVPSARKRISMTNDPTKQVEIL